MEIRTFVGEGFGENAYLATCTEQGVCVAVDPGAGAPDLVAAVQQAGTDLVAILLTHAHLDHIEGVATVRASFPDVPIWLHPADYGLYEGVQRQAAMFGLRAQTQPPPTDELTPGTDFVFGSCSLEVRFAPGHAPGHVIFVHHPTRNVLVGDVVFQGSIGRTDLPGGDFRTLIESIRDAVLTLEDDYVLHPGHGPQTTVGHERVTNPFLVPHYGGELA
ncbi:MAG: MBL fold metallo-hydrolase [Gemmatimonadota bacterium]